ncbi:hypothetical protein EMMF5_005933 [Cystobasidiomycetes sp. EMM_F5]
MSSCDDDDQTPVIINETVYALHYTAGKGFIAPNKVALPSLVTDFGRGKPPRPGTPHAESRDSSVSVSTNASDPFYMSALPSSPTITLEDGLSAILPILLSPSRSQAARRSSATSASSVHHRFSLLSDSSDNSISKVSSPNVRHSTGSVPKPHVHYTSTEPRRVSVSQIDLARKARDMELRENMWRSVSANKTDIRSRSPSRTQQAYRYTPYSSPDPHGKDARDRRGRPTSRNGERPHQSANEQEHASPALRHTEKRPTLAEPAAGKGMLLGSAFKRAIAATLSENGTENNTM